MEKRTNPSEITEIFINRVLTECRKTAFAKVEIPRSDNIPFMMILFAGKFDDAQRLVVEWKQNMDRRIQSSHGKELASLLEVKSGRQFSFDAF